MIKNFVLVLVAVVALSAFAVPTFAQKKVDVYLGAQVVRVNPDVHQPKFTFDNSTDSIGANFAVTGFVSKAVGVTGELAGTTKDGNSLITGLGGLTIQARRDKTVQPFVRGLVGVARERANNQQLTNVFDKSDLGLAYAVGGGIDVKVSKNVAVRLIQADFLRVNVFGQTQNEARVGAGIRF
jgi:hypothetical protein